MKKFTLFVGLMGFSFHAFAQVTAFTYQGRLNNGAAPANGTYELLFGLYEAKTGTNLLAEATTHTPVSNGLFSVTFDLGNKFPGASRWLQIGVRTSGAPVFTMLSPRQQITATPYAVHAADAASASSVAATNISGTVPFAILPSGIGTTNGFASIAYVSAVASNLAVTSNQLVSADYANGGFLNPTNFASVNVIGGANDREFPLPIGRFNTWYNAGPNHNATMISNMVNDAVRYGYPRRRIHTIMVTDGWQGERTNGFLYPNAKYLGVSDAAPWGSGTVTNNITNLLLHASANGMRLGIYTEPSWTTLAGFTGSYGYLEQDAKMFAAMGFRFVQFDEAIPFLERLLYQQQFARALRLTPQAAQRPIHLYSSGWGYFPDQPLNEIPNFLMAGTVNSFRTHGDPAFCPLPGCTWTNYLYFMDRDVEGLQYTTKGVYLDPEIGSLVPFGYENPTKGHFMWQCFVPMNISLNYPYGPSDGFRGMQITNDNLLVTLWSDALGDRATSVSSNANFQVFKRKLEAGRVGVYFQNRQMDTTNSATVLWYQLGLLTNSVYQVLDAWGGTNIGVFSNSFSWMIPTNSADCFIFTPMLLLAGNGGSLSNLNAALLASGTIPQARLSNIISADIFTANTLVNGPGLFANAPVLPVIGWGTQTLAQADSPNVKIYLHAGVSAWAAEDCFGGRNIFSYNLSSKNLTLGTGNSGENVVINGNSQLIGNGGGLTSLNASQLASGSVSADLLPYRGDFVVRAGTNMSGPLTNTGFYLGNSGIMLSNNTTGLIVANQAGAATNATVNNATARGFLIASNGFASYATNFLANYNTAGFTNALAGSNNGAGGTNIMQAHVTSVAGTIEMYIRSGGNGSSVCTQPIWTNTFSGVNSNLNFEVGINNGFVIRSGLGVAIQIYAR